MTESAKILDRLYRIIESRKGNNPASSYTAHLLSQGISEIARKVGEEAVETITAALTAENENIVAESADLLFHLLVLWSERDITPEEVWAELISPEGTSGIDEKAARPTNYRVKGRLDHGKL